MVYKFIKRNLKYGSIWIMGRPSGLPFVQLLFNRLSGWHPNSKPDCLGGFLSCLPFRISISSFWLNLDAVYEVASRIFIELAVLHDQIDWLLLSLYKLTKNNRMMTSDTLHFAWPEMILKLRKLYDKIGLICVDWEWKIIWYLWLLISYKYKQFSYK